MATLTHESKQRTGWRLRAYAAIDSGRRYSIWLGDIPGKEAETIRRHVEAIIESHKLGTPMPGETQRWLARIPDALRTKLIPVLGTARNVAQAVEAYLQWASTQHKPSTVATIGGTLRSLAKHFGPTQMRSLAAEDLDRWLATRNVAANTVAKQAKQIKTWVLWCRRQHWVDDLVVKTSSTIKPGKKQFVTTAAFDQLMAAITDREDRCALALVRWAGVRVPSELGILTADVDWDRRTLTIVDHKRSRRSGRAPPTRRVCPMFTELVPYLESIWNPESKLLLPNASRGGGFAKRIRKVRESLDLYWPRLNHSLRATRETELITQFGIHAASTWIGNSPEVARRNYELIDDATWAKAIAGPSLI